MVLVFFFYVSRFALIMRAKYNFNEEYEITLTDSKKIYGILMRFQYGFIDTCNYPAYCKGKYT